ncbi:centromere protein J-like isoform X2 [Cyclopterus lumpus]|uniref:centromere protein J-like isoform X2 n=1 Tax=Cyclopterus lumpus TaxID=8103 RepID=UPI001486A087|nr:centromere protein J-like isoform X2 [Cyclopterus lumpus]
MSSQAGLRCSQADFLARWMPGSTRAGVILGPVPDPTQGSPSLGPDDSFASDFAPLPGSSVDSSYLGVDGLARSPGGETAEREGPQSGLSSGVPRGSDGELEEMEGLPIRVKLEQSGFQMEHGVFVQLRKWQQHMQEQLKAHQLEELLRLQEEQQKLLGMMNGSPHGSEDDSEASGLSDSRETPYSSPINRHGVPPGSTRLEQEPPPLRERLPGVQDCEEVEDEDEGTCTSRGEDQEQRVSSSHFHAHDDALTSGSGGAMTSGSGGAMTSGSGGAMTSGSGGAMTSGSGGAMTSGSGGAMTSGSGGAMTSGSGGAMTSGSGGALTSGSGGEMTSGSGGALTSGSGGEMTSGSGGALTSGSGGAMTSGSGGAMTSGSGGEMTSGSGGALTSGSGGAMTSGSGGAMTSGSGGEMTSGSGGAMTSGSGGAMTSGSGGAMTSESGGAMTWAGSVDEVFCERPIEPGIKGQKKTFEELLEQQLRVEEQRLKSARQQQSHAPPKRAFLKRGEGLSRFTTGRKVSLPKSWVRKDPKDPEPQLQARVVSGPAALQRGVQRVGVQRKTATLNKENRPGGLSSPQDVRMSKAARMKVLGSHQRQNTEAPESIQSDPQEGKPPRNLKEQNPRNAGLSAPGPMRSTGPNTQQPDHVTTQGGAPRGPERAARPAAGESGASRMEPAAGGGGEGDGVSQEWLESSFQDKIRRWHCDRQLETVELGEFELLEQAAEELSFSSNSSFVMKVLQIDQQHRGLHPRRLSSTPIKSPPGSGAGSAGKISSVPPDAFVVKMSGDEDSEGSTCGAAELEEREAALEPPSFPTQPDPPYDKQSYQDEESSGDDASTLNEDAVVFDDDDTWNELDGAGSANDSRGVSPAGAARTLSRKVSRAVQLDEDAPPPASQLMTRLFPSLNPKAQNAPLHPAPAVAPGQQLQSRQLRERLVELEIEIQRFKKENAALSKLRHENEEQQELLRKERLVFERTRAEELAELEEHKREENRKLQKERKLFEKHATAARAIPDKKEREEIQVLKQQLSSLQEELRGRESRWASSHSRLRQQMDSLGQENGALRDQIRMLEKLRLSTWRKTPVEAEKDREAKDPRTCEGNATKGVKFASPLDSRGGGGSPPQSSTAAATRRSSHAAAAGMKSSLRRPSVPCLPSSSSLPSRRTDERPATKNQELDGSPKNESLPNEAESAEDLEAESAEDREAESAEDREAESAEDREAESAEDRPPPDGKVETLLASGERLVVFNNGTRKEVSADGQTVKVTFFNGDTKEVTADQRIYFYADAQTTHITFPDGVEVLHFPNNQTEKHFPDGRKEIVFPDQTVKNLFPGGREESVLTDGTVIQVSPDGTKQILFNTGQKEVHTAGYKRREYPDGTVKTVYADGRQETRYPNGRLRVKDRDGNVVLDSGA